MNILLAEDNKMNAILASRRLTMLGHKVVTASNGFEVLDECALGAFDLILMDVEMPEMDGLEATRRIRKGEAGEDKRSIPIIAMTAHAASEFEKKCLIAGMNSYVAKPLDFDELASAMAHVRTHGHASHPEHTVSQKNNDETKLLDREEALRRLDNNEQLLIDVYEIFVKEVDERVQNLQKAVAERDFKKVRFQAHALKSSTGTVGSEACRALAEQLESEARAKNADRLDTLSAVLFTRLDTVKRLIVERHPELA